MPQLDEMKCVVCEEIFTKEEIEKYEGMCEACHQAMNEAVEQEEKQREAGVTDDIEVSTEMQQAINAHRKRQAYMRKYNEDPKVQAKRKEYMKSRAAKQKLLIQRAKDLGIMP